MWALLAAKVDPDGVDDELCPLDRGSPVTGRRRRALGDDVTGFQLALPVPNAAVIVGARDSAHEATAGPKIELNAPLVVAFTEVKAVTVDLSGPLFVPARRDCPRPLPADRRATLAARHRRPAPPR